jgi:hypothetical protein
MKPFTAARLQLQNVRGPHLNFLHRRPRSSAPPFQKVFFPATKNFSTVQIFFQADLQKLSPETLLLLLTSSSITLSKITHNLFATLSQLSPYKTYRVYWYEAVHGGQTSEARLAGKSDRGIFEGGGVVRECKRPPS